MIAAIGFNAFKDSPVFGVGAGGYLQLVGNSRAFFVEFGPAFDAHGIIQKVAGELGGIGLLALGILLYALGHTMWKNNKALSTSSDEREAYMYLCILVASMFLLECFSTTYWTPRLWLPVGLVLAASRVFVSSEKAKDPDFLKETLLK